MEWCIGNGQVHQLYLSEKVGTLNCMDDQQKLLIGGGGEPLEENNVRTVVRRLTPIECERLQSLPDNWTDLGDWVDSKGKNHKAADSPRYKAIGNGLALPFWEWLARRIAAQYEGKVTMGSLFDGISGFPLAFARAGVKPLWTSEIEEFPKAVCRKHFGDEDTGEEGDFYKYLIGE